MRVLHLEDSADDCALIEHFLAEAWPDCEVVRVENRADYESALARGGFDVILSDFALPGFDGLTALQIARSRCPDKPYLFISGTIGEERAIDALKHGAADYVLKDRPSRLVPAIRRALAVVEEGEKRRLAEAQLREQAILLDKARDAIIATDLELKISYWNPSAEKLYGWPSTLVLGRPLGELGLHSNPARLRKALGELLAAGEWRGDFQLQTRDGAIVQVETTWSLVYDREGQPRSLLLIDTDVTEKRKYQSQLLHAERLDSIGMLAGGVAHDLNNVLAPIMMATELLRDKLTDPHDRRLVETIYLGAGHGAALVRQLVAFAHGSEGERTLVALPALLADVRVILRSGLPKTIKLTTAAVEPLRPIRGDGTQIKQVLLNLCLNARDAMPTGGEITIRAEEVGVSEALARSQPGLAPGDFVRVAVRDTGTGIPPGILGKIFDPFFTTKGLGKGTGLGLSMVLGIVKSHGGFLTVESRPGQGTTFLLYFPAAEAA
jgi:two-component system cell cycle sensor histidine kinase/response regulator CckA